MVYLRGISFMRVFGHVWQLNENVFRCCREQEQPQWAHLAKLIYRNLNAECPFRGQ